MRQKIFGFLPTFSRLGNWNEFHCSRLNKKVLLLSVLMLAMTAGAQNNVIKYTSTDGNVVTPNKNNFGGANILSNTYADGQGMIVFDQDLTTLETQAFYGCRTLSSIVLPNSVTSMGGMVFRLCSNLKSAELGNSLRAIPDDAFNACSMLESIVIPNSATSIGGYAFNGCSKLTTITIGSSVTSIGTWALENCSTLREIISLNPTPPTVGYKALSGVPISTCQLKVPSANLEAYSGWGGFTNIVSADNQIIYYTSTDGKIINVGTTGYGANFLSHTYDDGQGMILFDGDITTIPGSLYYENMNLQSYVIPNSVTRVYDRVFFRCYSLKKLTIGENVGSFGERAINQCYGLEEIISYNPVPPSMGNKAIDDAGNRSTTVVRVPIESVNLYKERWGFVNTIGIQSSFTFEDGTDYTRNVTYNGVDITYTRTFKNDAWQPLYIPFSLDVVADLGDDYTVAEINGVHQFDMDGDGDFDETWIEFRTVKSGETRPNTPYVIKAAEAGEKTISLTNKTLCAAATNSVDCSTSRHLYTLTGTYSEIADIEGKYAMKGGEFAPGTQGVNTIKPQRIYLEISERDGGYGTTTAPAQMPARVRVMVDGQATSIEGITTDLPTSAAPMYNLHGVRVGSDYKGIVIQNGKKILKR